MTKGELIDMVLIPFGGNLLSQDVQLKREDINATLPEAIAYVINIWNANDREKYEDIQTFGVIETTFDFYLTVKVSPTFSEERGMYYFELPRRVQQIRGKSSIRDLFPSKGLTSYVRVAGRREIMGIENTGTYYWHETEDNKSRIYVTNLGLPVCDHHVQYLMNVADMDMSEEVPLPGGVGFNAIELLVNFFSKKQPDLATDDRQR